MRYFTPSKKFHIRAEFPDRRYEDVRILATTLEKARQEYEREYKGSASSFHWRGAVVFVNHLPRTVSNDVK